MTCSVVTKGVEIVDSNLPLVFNSKLYRISNYELPSVLQKRNGHHSSHFVESHTRKVEPSIVNAIYDVNEVALSQSSQSSWHHCL